ncbi:hypothetical protein AO263_18905 [Pseudomonas sp. NZIPFR-PS5]|nr:hypothetical protein AO263_18905 [Pseudomonas sp. NZIPFR-PS5]
MVKVGFIVEGASEKIVIESSDFRAFLHRNGFELLDPVVDAQGGGNLLPQHLRTFVETLSDLGADRIFILTDLERDISVDVVRARIQHDRVEMAFIAIKALEAWFLADGTAMNAWLGGEHIEAFPEQTTQMPYDRLKEIARNLGLQGPGRKVMLAKKMVDYGFSVTRAAAHPECGSARELVAYFGT